MRSLKQIWVFLYPLFWELVKSPKADELYVDFSVLDKVSSGARIRMTFKMATRMGDLIDLAGMHPKKIQLDEESRIKICDVIHDHHKWARPKNRIMMAEVLPEFVATEFRILRGCLQKLEVMSD